MDQVMGLHRVRLLVPGTMRGAQGHWKGGPSEHAAGARRPDSVERLIELHVFQYERV